MKDLKMTSKEFIRSAKHWVLQEAKQGLDPTDKVELNVNDDVYVVTYSFVLWNHKALLSTTLPDGKYYEVTLDAATGKMYIDCYVRIKQNVVEIGI